MSGLGGVLRMLKSNKSLSKVEFKFIVTFKKNPLTNIEVCNSQNRLKRNGYVKSRVLNFLWKLCILVKKEKTKQNETWAVASDRSGFESQLC